MKAILGTLLCIFTTMLLISCEEKGSGGGDINNPEGAPVLTCADFNQDIELEDVPGREVDYIIDCLVEIEDIEVEIIDGAVIEFTEGSGLIFKEGSRSSFFALPGAVDPVILRGNKDQAGYWKGIRFEEGSESNTFNGVEIYNAGSKSDKRFYGAITIAGGANIGSTLIDGSANYGVYYEDEIGVWNSFTNVEITNCGSYPVRISSEDVGELTGWSSNSYSGNNPDRIQVATVPLTKASVTYRDQGIPYEISTTLTYDRISIEDDVELIFKSGCRLIVEGQMTAWDDGGDPIKFTSHNGMSGGWQGIYFKTNYYTTGTGNKLVNILVEYGGDPSVDMAANIAVESGKINMEDCQIRNSAACGLKYIANQTTYLDNGNYFLNNAGGSVCEIN